MKNKSILVSISALVILTITIMSFTLSSNSESVNLTGVWQSEGGKYYIKQIGNDIYWLGEDSPNNPGWTNVAFGKIQGNKITLNWADVPKGGADSNGKLVLKIAGERKLVRESETGGFGCTEWNKK